ncbi:MAG TPA: hypothetical protein VJ696_01395 [Rhodanobacteraceae bacterium]|nr:hypothetical protein [Rhodanobacteraceae bacterium]
MTIRTPGFASPLRLAAAALTASFSTSLTAQAVHVNFNLTFDDSASLLTEDERQEIYTNLSAAGNRWVRVIGLRVPRNIEVLISVADIPTANGASVTTVLAGTIDGRETYEQGVAYEFRLNQDPNEHDPDAHITFGLDYLRNELWFDPDPEFRTMPVPADRTDAVSVLMHEMGHVLAYNGWSDLTTGTPPDTYWSLWDSWIAPGAAPAFTGSAAVAAWGSAPALTIGNINHWGNPDSGMRAARCIAAPVAWRWNAPMPAACDAPPSADRPHDMTDASLIDQLMNGVVFYRGTRYEISALDIGVLIDVGLMEDRIFASGFEHPQ